MSKTVEQWLLFKYVGGELTPLSKPFKTKKQAEKALKLDAKNAAALTVKARSASRISRCSIELIRIATS